MLRTVAITVLLTVGWVHPAWTQDSGQPAPPQQPCTRRTIAVSVTDKNGEPVTGLTAADFRGEFRGQPVQILSVTTRIFPMRIVVVLDRSGSMQDKWAVVMEAARHIYAIAPSDVSLGLILFNDVVTDKLYFENPRAAVINALVEAEKQKGAAKGRTALLDALGAALDMNPQPLPADVIYVIADGEENRSRTKYGELEKRLLASDMRVFAFEIYTPFSPRNRNPNEFIAKSQLASMADESGGAILPLLVAEKDLARHFVKFYQRMTEPYELQIELPVEVDKKRDWKLELVRAKELKRPELTYPRKLVPCPVPAVQAAIP